MFPSDNGYTSAAANAPLVSVVVPSYNHVRYISKALDSVLTQDFADYELLISDDASLDNSWEIISGLGDARIRSFRQEQNLGPVGNLVFLIKQSRGKYIALLNSDDAWQPEKLRKQVAVMEAQTRVGACFTWAEMIDEQGREVSGADATWKDVFRQPNRTQGEWLRHFFFKGNCLCHPSILIRKEVYDFLGFYNPALKQLPDFEMWIRLVKHYPIHVIEENLVAHLRNGENTSTVSPENTARNLTELVEIFGSFFEGVPDEVFVEGFASDFRLKDVPPTPMRLRCEMLFLLLDSAFAHASGRVAALSSFMKHFSDPEFERILRDEYRFSVLDFYRLTGTSGFGHFLMLAVNSPTPVAAETGDCLRASASRSIHMLKRLTRRVRERIQGD